MDKNLLHVATHLLATGRTAFSLFLAQYPDTILVLIALGLLAFWWQHHRLVVWRRCAAENREGQVKAQEECGRRHLKIQALSKENALFIDQLSYWDALFDCLDRQWTVVGRSTVRRFTNANPEQVGKGREHLGNKDNPFEPMPPERPKKLRNGADYESAFILLRITSKDKFDIAVVRPVDMKVFLTNSQNGSALIKVELRRKKYYFDIPKSVRGTGAASLALAYAIQHATRMGIPALEAPLTHIDDEEHRIRLCGFYSRKFQFQYRAADGYIIKSLL